MAGLRKKAAKAKGRAESGGGGISKSTRVTPSVLAHDRNPFLHLSKVSKKEKREDKKSSFLSQMAVANKHDLSKSSRRRLNRKQKSKLSSNLGDLLESLADQVDTSTSHTTGYIPPKTKAVNPKSSAKSQEKVVQHEIQRFKSVLGEQQYRKNPFGSLKGLIAKNLENTI